MLHSAGVAITHVITTQLPRKQRFHCEAVVRRWETVQIRRPLDPHLRGRRGAGGGAETLLTGRRVSTLPFLQGDIIDGDVALDARSPDALQHHL